MNYFGEMSESGSVLSVSEMRERRKKRGECENCGERCFEKHLFKTIPITVNKKVLDGRCLRCTPHSVNETTAYSNSSLKKSARLGWKREKLHRNHDDTFEVSDIVVPVTKTKLALLNSAVGLDVTVKESLDETSAPVWTRHREIAIGEENLSETLQADSDRDFRKDEVTLNPRPINNKSGGTISKSVYNQDTVVGALKMHENFRVQLSIGANQERNSSTITTDSFPQMQSITICSSSIENQTKNNLQIQDLEVKRSIRSVAKEQSIELDKRIDKKLRKSVRHTTPIQLTSEPRNATELEAMNTIDFQILRKMDEANGSYIDTLYIAARYPSSLRIQRRAIHCLSTFYQFTESDKNHILTLGIIKKIIVDGMNSSSNDRELQLDACRFLWKMSNTSNKNKISVGSTGVIEAIYNAMDNFPQDEQIQEMSIAALSYLSDVEQNQDSIRQRGGIGKIVRSMATHHKCLKIHEYSCIAFKQLATHGYSMKTAINEARGCEQISISMVENQMSVGFLQKALCAISALCLEHNDNKVSVINCGAFDSIISAMQIHRDEPKLQAIAASTIWNVGCYDVTAPLIGECGGIDVLLRAMWLHSSSLDVQQWSCRALKILTVNPENQKLIADTSGCAAVVHAMQVNPDDAEIQRDSCGILANLAKLSDDIKMKIVLEESLDAITIAMVLHNDDVQVQGNACSAIQNLVCASTLNQLHASKVVELMNSAAVNFPSECHEKAKYLTSILVANKFSCVG